MFKQLLIVSVSIFMGASVSLAQDTYIVCTIKSTHDLTTGRTSGTSGSDVFVARPQSDGSTTYTLPFPCDEGTVKASKSDTELGFECDQRLGEPRP